MNTTNTPVALLTDYIAPFNDFDPSLTPWGHLLGKQGSSKANILLVAGDDNPDCETIADAVAKSGCRLARASNSQQAFEALSSDPNEIDAVVIDLDRGIDSFSLLEAIRDRVDAPPVIGMTAMKTFSPSSAASMHNVVRCLSKPLSTTKLARLIEDVCTLSRRIWQTSDRWGHIQPRRMRPACA